MVATNRQRLREAIRQTGTERESLAAEGVSLLAIELSSRFPQSGLTINSIEDEIRAAGNEKSEMTAKAELRG